MGRKRVSLEPPIRADVVVHFRRPDGSCVRYERGVALEVAIWSRFIDQVLNSDGNGFPMPIGDRPVGSECTDHVA